jgi:hypothetical protein
MMEIALARSPSHKFGQIIGEVLEATLYAPLKNITDKHGLFLDYAHERKARGGKRKVAWQDFKGNIHDLDYVIEDGGSEDVLGKPKAFIESAWRRYTKHSRNKTQEIQGAILPLAETYCEQRPFLGVVLAGVFTEGSLQQLRSNGFTILYFPYEVIVRAFSTVGVDAQFEEETPDAELQNRVDAYTSLSSEKKASIVKTLRKLRQKELKVFLESLEMCLARKITRVFIATLHGPLHEHATIQDAVKFITGYDESQPTDGFVKYEVGVRYNNGDSIQGDFTNKRTAIDFLEGLL